MYYNLGFSVSSLVHISYDEIFKIIAVICVMTGNKRKWTQSHDSDTKGL